MTDERYSALDIAGRQDWDTLPAHMRDAVSEYILNGRRPGDFLKAFLTNDLRETFGRADHINIHAVFDFLKFFYNCAPSQCWGSLENYEAWIKQGGLQCLHETKSAS